MKATSPIPVFALSIAFLAALVFLVRFLVESDPVPLKGPSRPISAQSEDRGKSEASRALPLPPKRDSDEFPAFPDLAEELLVQSLAGSEVLRDLTLGFSSREKMNLFLAGAEKNGIRVLGSIPELASVRVRFRDVSKGLRYMDDPEWKGEVSPQYNYPVHQPQLPRAESLEGEKGFADGAPDWLGASEDRADWGKGIKVAVLDSGVDLSHPALQGADLKELSLLEGEPPAPGHGTAVASIIAGKSEGLKGLAPAASILSIRVLNEKGEGDSFTVAQGIVHAVDQGADVINLSLGGESSSALLEHAVGYARSKGVAIVAAVGNEGTRGVAFPARYEGVIGVTSIDAKGSASAFSNYGEGVDLAAPGVDVYSAWEEEGIVSFSGTSTASAFVAGALAAEFSKNPTLPREQVVDLLYEFANESEKPGFDEFTGHGVLNVGRVDNRFDPYVADAAIVGYYFDPAQLREESVPFLVSVQNQGTLWLKNVELEVDLMGKTRKFMLSDLNPGEVKSERLFLESGPGKEGVRIQSRLRVLEREDAKPVNNVRASTITLPSK